MFIDYLFTPPKRPQATKKLPPIINTRDGIPLTHNNERSLMAYHRRKARGKA